jgi:hypothetical protein
MFLNDAALCIDHKNGRQRADSAVGYPQIIGSHGDWIIDTLGTGKLTNETFILFIHSEPDDLELILVVLLQLNEAGNFRAARAAPGGPKVEQNNSAAKGIEFQWFPVEIFQFEGGSLIGIPNETQDWRVFLGGNRKRRERCNCRSANEGTQKEKRANWKIP